MVEEMAGLVREKVKVVNRVVKTGDLERVGEMFTVK